MNAILTLVVLSVCFLGVLVFGTLLVFCCVPVGKIRGGENVGGTTVSGGGFFVAGGGDGGSGAGGGGGGGGGGCGAGGGGGGGC